MQTFMEILKYILESNIINFCLMLMLFVWLYKKFNVGALFSNSVKKVEEYIEKSNLEKQKSSNLVVQSQELASRLPAQIEEINRFNNQKVDIFRKQLEQVTQKNIEKINNSTERVIEIEEKEISNSIMNYSFHKSIEKATNDIIGLLETQPDLHKKFIEESLKELEQV